MGVSLIMRDYHNSHFVKNNIFMSNVEKMDRFSKPRTYRNFTQYGPITNVVIFPLLKVPNFCPDFHC